MERNYSIDFVKFFAIFFVAAIHTGTVSGVQVGSMNGDDIDFFIDSFARFAVPFFFITSGYLFMQKMISIQDSNESVLKKQIKYFKKYTVKLIKLYFSWFIFYFLFELITNFIETEKTTEALSSMFVDYINSYNFMDIFYYGSDSPQYHLWFLPALIWAIIIVFIFMKMRLLKVLFIVSLGLHIYGLFGQSYSAFHEVTLNTCDAIFFALFYITMGALFAKYYDQVKVFAYKIVNIEYLILLIILSFVQVLEAFVTMKIFSGNAQNYFITTIPLIIILFLAIIKHPNIGRNTFISKIGANAVGIYVSHVFIMFFIRILMDRFGLTAIQDTVTWKILFTPAVFFIAYFFYAGIQKFKAKFNIYGFKSLYSTK
ncbi:acyltransferase family protein [Virgibacillus phasianinus]|uniref:acyltransferase family protein n=1 Tax=Virgibacillus phasianinus TaxID=2017483 RepID=UPI0012FD74FE|nr:acyltransferase [Virgibacillus phasianinus]